MSSAPNPKVKGAGKKSENTSLLASFEKKVNLKEHMLLVEARGCEPSGTVWKVQALAPSLQVAFDFFKNKGVRGLRVVSSTEGNSSAGRQNRGEPVLFLGVIGEGA